MSATLDDLTLHAPQDEHPHPVRPEVPLWSENYAFVAYSPGAEVGLFVHLGRAPYNPDLWRGTAVALLPRGELAVTKSLGLARDPSAPASGPLSAFCERPLERWSLRHHGPAMRTSRAAASSALVVGAEPDHLEFEISFDALHPTSSRRERSAARSPLARSGTRSRAPGSGTTRSGRATSRTSTGPAGRTPSSRRGESSARCGSGAQPTTSC